MSFGHGITVRQGAESIEVLRHEEGHELDAMGPYFKKGYNPRAGNSEIAKRLASVSDDAETEKQTIKMLVDVLYNTNNIFHFHTEFIQYLREGGRLSLGNPLASGGLYDPLLRWNDENFLKLRLGKSCVSQNGNVADSIEKNMVQKTIFISCAKNADRHTTPQGR